jgi:hypothetical protein
MLTGPVDGRTIPEVRNRELLAEDLGSVRCLSTLNGDHQPEGYLWSIAYIDGEATGVADPLDGFGSDALPVGGHDIDMLVLWREWGPPSLGGRVIGRRCVLTWSPVTSSDLEYYNVYWDEGEGGDVDTLLGQVSLISSYRVAKKVPTSGTGTGRISITGYYRGPLTNGNWTITISSSGYFTYNIGAGASDPIEFAQGDVLELPMGLRVRFEDSVSDYDTSDSWTWMVGVQNVYLTGELAEGTYQFALTAVDTAGNESAASSAVSVAIDHGPDAPSDFAGTYDDDDREVVLTWTDGAGSTHTRIYSNYDPAFEVIRDYVAELNPIATIAAETETYTLTLPAGVNGEVLFYARSYDGTVEEDNIELLRVQAVASPASTTVSAPFDLTGSAIAAGKARITWRVDLVEATPASFNIYVFTSEPDAAAWASATATDNVAYDDATATGVDIRTPLQTWDSDALAGQRWFGVRAVDSSGLETDNTDVVSVTPDDTAPSAPSGLMGVSL